MSKPKIKINFLRIVIFSIMALIFLFLIYIDAFSHVRPDITDKLYGNNKVLNNILIIKIDDNSLQKIGRWPWDREIHANLLSKLNNSKYVALDISFFEESNEKSDSTLQREVYHNHNVILASEISGSFILNPIFESKHGYVNVITESDGVVRRVSKSLHESELPFSFVLYKEYLNLKNT